MMNKPFHLLLFSVNPVVFLYARNYQHTSLLEVVISVLFVLVFSFLILRVFRLVIKIPVNAAIATSIFIVLFFLFAPISLRIITPVSLEILGRHIKLLYGFLGSAALIFAVITPAILVLLRRCSVPLYSVTGALNVMALVMIVLSAMPMSGKVAARSEPAINEENDRESRLLEGTKQYPGKRPDIYYIVLDGRGRSDTLRDLYGYSDHRLARFFADKGFYLAERSYCNYNRTSLSLVSTFNMKFVNDVNEYGVHGTSLKGSEVINKVKEYGYRTAHISSGGFNIWTEEAEFDISLNRQPIREFYSALVSYTPLYPLGNLITKYAHRRSVLSAFDRLAEIANNGEPTFYYVHVLSPHEPVVFQRDGSAVSWTKMLNKGSDADKRRLYAEQVEFIDLKVMEVIETILDESAITPIIIIQSDHGPKSRARGIINPEAYAKGSAEKRRELIKERSGILNAYLFPDGGKEVLYQSITPVNTFRVLFNQYFGGNYELLSDQVFIAGYAGNVDAIEDVTSELGDVP